MRYLSGFLLALCGHVLRLASGMVVFIVLARELGPSGFGIFSFWLAIATLLTIPVNFGFATMVLRSFGAESERAVATLGEILAAKSVLALGVGAACLFALPWLSTASALVFLCLLSAQFAESFSEFYNLSFRVNANFRGETITASFVSAFHLVVMLVAVWLRPGVTVAASVFMVSRIVGLFVVRAHAAKSLRAVGSVRCGSFASVPVTLRRAWAYALELGLFTLHSQFDSVIVKAMLGVHWLGIYQSGMKLVQGASRIAPVFAQVLLPELARSAGDAAQFRRLATRTAGTFVLVGGAGCALLTVGGAPLTLALFGSSYLSLVPLLGAFGVFLLLRFAETGVGLLLVARNLQGIKVWLVGLQIGVLLGAAWPVMRAHGLEGWLWLNNMTLAALLLAYCALLALSQRSSIVAQRLTAGKGT
jgi:O-antigen/teichoic acid export membrane protein